MDLLLSHFQLCGKTPWLKGYFERCFCMILRFWKIVLDLTIFLSFFFPGCDIRTLFMPVKLFLLKGHLRTVHRCLVFPERWQSSVFISHKCNTKPGPQKQSQSNHPLWHGKRSPFSTIFSYPNGDFYIHFDLVSSLVLHIHSHSLLSSLCSPETWPLWTSPAMGRGAVRCAVIT